MGDHRIGEAMGRAADIWWQGHTALPSKDEALLALDAICGPYRKRDAEFEASDPQHPTQIHPDYDNYTDPDGPIGQLIVIAFDATPDEMSLGDEAECPWFDGPYMRFSAHYEFW